MLSAVSVAKGGRALLPCGARQRGHQPGQPGGWSAACSRWPIDLGRRRLNGFAEPPAAWRVEGEGRAKGRFEALHRQRVTLLVGREHELAMLVERWAWARRSGRAAGRRAGDRQVALDPGAASPPRLLRH